MYEITLKFCGLCHVSLELLLGGSIMELIDMCLKLSFAISRAITLSV